MTVRHLVAWVVLSVPALAIVTGCGREGQAAQALKDEGAEKVVAYITHPVLSGGAVEKITSSALDELVVTDTPVNQNDTRSIFPAPRFSRPATTSMRWWR